MPIYGVHVLLRWSRATANIRRVQNTVTGQKLIIADGHHRYETALNFRNESRVRAGVNDPYAAPEFAMMTFINTHSKGLTILPTHRLTEMCPTSILTSSSPECRASLRLGSVPVSKSRKSAPLLSPNFFQGPRKSKSRPTRHRSLPRRRRLLSFSAAPRCGPGDMVPDVSEARVDWTPFCYTG